MKRLTESEDLGSLMEQARGLVDVLRDEVGNLRFAEHKLDVMRIQALVVALHQRVDEAYLVSQKDSKLRAVEP